MSEARPHASRGPRRAGVYRADLGMYSTVTHPPGTRLLELPTGLEGPAAAGQRPLSRSWLATESPPTACRRNVVPREGRVSPAGLAGVGSPGDAPGAQAAAVLPLARDGALGGVRHQRRVLVKDATRVARLGRPPLAEALLELGRRQLDVEPALFDVDVDGVAAAQRGDRTAFRRLGNDVGDHETVGGAGEAPVGH